MVWPEVAVKCMHVSDAATHQAAQPQLLFLRLVHASLGLPLIRQRSGDTSPQLPRHSQRRVLAVLYFKQPTRKNSFKKLEKGKSKAVHSQEMARNQTHGPGPGKPRKIHVIAVEKQKSVTAGTGDLGTGTRDSGLGGHRSLGPKQSSYAI